MQSFRDEPLFLNLFEPPPEDDWEKHKQWMNEWFKRTPNSGEKWYMLKRDWLDNYKKWLGSDRNEPDPGPLNISGIVGPDNTLIGEECQEDVADIPEQVWKYFEKRFAIKDGLSAIRRNVVFTHPLLQEYKVERRMQPVYFVHHNDPKTLKFWNISRNDRLFEIEAHMRKCFGIDKKILVRVYHLWNEELEVWESFLYKFNTLDTLYEFMERRRRVFLIEEQNADGTWPRTPPRDPSLPVKRIGEDLDRMWGYERTTKVLGGHTVANKHPGLCGMMNFENNCYMSATIQAMAQIPSLRDYFLTDMHLRELNPENPLSRIGNFAKEFGDVMKHIWGTKYCDIKTTKFKREMGKYKEEYRGYEMHDAHEFLIYLLDGIHEDCNRIKDKPYVEMKDSNNRPDKEVAAEAWESYKKRNDSVIVDIFYGLSKSCVVCAKCKNQSVTFEPTPCLSLPIPNEEFFMKQISFKYCDPTKPVLHFRLPLSKDMTVEDCKALIIKEVTSDVQCERMLLGRFTYNRLFEVYPEDPREKYPLQAMLKGSESGLPVCMLEVPNAQEDKTLVDIRIDIMVLSLNCEHTYDDWLWGKSSFFYFPFYIRVQKDSTYDQMYEAIKEGFGDRIELPPETDQWWIWSEEDQKEERAIVDSLRRFSHRHVDLSNKNDEWEKNGKHYMFRIIERSTESGLPNNDKAQDVFKKGGPLTVDFHPLYARKYLVKKICQEPNVNVLASWKKDIPPRPTLSLYDCLKAFHKNENLGGGDTWYCSKCKSHRDCIKASGIWTLPNYLIIHLKRFQYSEHYDSEKISAMVTYPEYGLDLDSLVCNPDHIKGSGLYDLIGLTNHHGKNNRHGHYSSVVKYLNDQFWYYFNDANVLKAYSEQLLSRGSYLLFYKRRGTEELKFTAPPEGVMEPECPEFPEENTNMPGEYAGPYKDMSSFGMIMRERTYPFEMI